MWTYAVPVSAAFYVAQIIYCFGYFGRRPKLENLPYPCDSWEVWFTFQRVLILATGSNICVTRHVNWHRIGICLPDLLLHTYSGL